MDPGVYTVTFEAEVGFSGFMTKPAPSPLSVEWFSDGSGWHQYDPLDVGVRIGGVPLAVAELPLPGSVSLVCAAIAAGAAGARRRRPSKAEVHG